MSAATEVSAVVLTEQWTLELRSIDARPPRPHEVRLRPLFCGICGTDLHARSLRDHFRPPVVLGHEFSGRIEELGDRVEGWAIGQRVVVNPNGNTCGGCPACLSGRPNLCRRAVRERGIGIAEDGGLAGSVCVDVRTLTALPDAVDDLAAAWVEPLATVVRAVETNASCAGTRVCVVGAGSIGLLAVQVLRAAGAAVIVCVEPNAARRRLARELGADDAVAVTETDRVGRVDVVIECSGADGALALCQRLTDAGGSIVAVGIAGQAQQLDPFELVLGELNIRGSIIYVDEFDAAVELLARGDVDVERLTTAVRPISEFREVFDNPGAGVKTLLHP